MKNEQENKLLSAQTLQAFLDGSLPPEQQGAVQRLLNDCELNREALAGYTLFPEAFADVSGLQQQFKVPSTPAVSPWTWLATGAFVLTALGWWWSSDSEKPVPVNETKVAAPIMLQSPQVVLSPQEEHFVNPEAKTIKVQLPAVVVTPETPTVDQRITTTEILPPLTITLDNTVPQPQAPLQPSAQQNIGYIYDLKVSDFDKYYRGSIEVSSIEPGGTPAVYEQKTDRTDVIAPTTRSIPAEEYLRKGLKAFRDEKYQRCVNAMTVLYEHNPKDINAQFYLGLSYFNLDQYAMALKKFDELLAGGTHAFTEEAEWYRALTLERQGKKEAQEAFAKIAQGQGFYAKKAQGKLKP
jgi:hypothetical protein